LVTAELDEEATHVLLHDAPAALRVQVAELLLASLALALRRRVPEGAFAIDVEGHGREEIFPDVDLSRSVGWFTSIHPLVLDPGVGGDAATALARVKEQVRAVPDRGLGYGVLRYLDAESAALLARRPAAPVSFNYLGRVDAGLASGPFRRAPEPSGRARSPRAAREHHVGFGAWVEGDRLRLDVSFHPAAYPPAAAEALANGVLESLRELLALVQEPRAVAPAASDFPLLDLGTAELEGLLGEVGFEGVGAE
jgi:non-ribosomal peptide synthase protein (TIGR01720 family)